MKETILRVILFPLTLFIIIQPFLSQKDYLLDLLVKANTAYAAQKAAPLGGVTPDIKNQVLQNLESVGFSEGEIDMTYDTTMKERQERIDVKIQIPRPALFLINFGTETGPQYYYGHSYVMSELLE